MSAVLRVNHDNITTIERALETAQKDLVSKVTEIRAELERGLDSWGETTASRRAQKEFDKKLDDAVRDLGEALGKVRTALEDVKKTARGAEVLNVASIG